MKGISLFFILFLSACATDHKDMTPNGQLSRQFQQCYWESDSIYAEPPVQGKMKLKVKVHHTGKAEEVKIIESAFAKDRNFEACVTGLLKRFPYNPSKDESPYYYDQEIDFIKKNRR